MGFKKTGIAITTPTPVNPFPQVGEEKDGLFWDGQDWVSKEVFNLKGEFEIVEAQLKAGLGVPTDGDEPS